MDLEKIHSQTTILFNLSCVNGHRRGWVKSANQLSKAPLKWNNHCGKSKLYKTQFPLWRTFLTYWIDQFSSVQSFSRVWFFVTLCTAAHQAYLSITNSWSLLKFMFIESVMPSNHRILCRPLLLLPSIFPSIKVFSSESALCIRWPTYWSFSFSISPSNEHSGLVSFRIDWFDLLAAQGILKSLLQHYSSKASIL